VLFLLPIYLAQRFAMNKGRRYGWIWGALLGWIGVLVVVLLSDKRLTAL
jgi:hypothetical protein